MPHVTPTASLAILPSSTAVVIVGAGPVGLLTAFQLSKFGWSDYIIIDKESKSTQQPYGRACTLWPRTLELWDQLGLMDDMFAAGGVISETGYNFQDTSTSFHPAITCLLPSSSSEAAPMPSFLSYAHKMSNLGGTAFPFCMNLRQGIIEKVIRSKLLNDYEVNVFEGHEMNGMTQHEENVSVWGEKDGKRWEMNAINNFFSLIFAEIRQYVIGTDGGRSAVRKLAGVEFRGTRSNSKWVRMDAEIQSNIPNSRSLNSYLSPSHGHILLCPIDNKLTRIGYVLSSALQEKWGLDLADPEDHNRSFGTKQITDIAEDEIVKEAKLALRPFEVDFQRVDWFTVYGIGQCIAQEFVKGRIILAGDACHTHSSGSAQGLNTGCQDSINLCWKLILFLTGCSSPSLMLRSYDQERKTIAQKVIDNDTRISSLISGIIPPDCRDRKESADDLLSEWIGKEENKMFTLGLGVRYEKDGVMNKATLSWPICTINPGERLPDSTVHRVGTNDPIRLHTVFQNSAQFHVIVLTGNPFISQALGNYHAFYVQSAREGSINRYKRVLRFITIMSGHDIGTTEILQGLPPVGIAYFDPLRKAHEAYGVDTSSGAVIVIRPDGFLGTAIRLGADSWKDVDSYFDGFLIRNERNSD